MSKSPSRVGMLVLRDTREQTPLRFSSDVTVQSATLPTGDYSLAGFSDRVAIERKCLSNFVSCVGSERERFMDEMGRLRDDETRAVAIEASVRDVTGHRYRSQMNPSSVIGTSIAIWADFGVPTGPSASACRALDEIAG